MDCYAWNIPAGCYDAALDTSGQCPLPWWFWLAVVGAVGLAASSGRKHGVHDVGRRSVTSSTGDAQTLAMVGAGILALMLLSGSDQASSSDSSTQRKSKQPCPMPNTEKR
jgi:hypothetical protein